MNQYVFAMRNILDKFFKVICNWNTFIFYLHTYFLSNVDSVDPDVYIVSYPKCGRTWLRVMLQKYLEILGSSQHHFNDRSLMSISKGRTIKFEHDQGNWVPVPRKINQLSFNISKYSGKKNSLPCSRSQRYHDFLLVSSEI